MKKFILISCLVLSFSLKSQEKSKFGAEAGFISSSFSGSDNDGFSSSTGFQVGLFLWNDLSEKLAVDVGLNYSQLGAKFETTSWGMYKS